MSTTDLATVIPGDISKNESEGMEPRKLYPEDMQHLLFVSLLGAKAGALALRNQESILSKEDTLCTILFKYLF